MLLTLTRTYFPEGTNGMLFCEGQLIAHTIELPWRQNARLVSCIPEGEYLIQKRYSAKFKWHLEITGVPGRSLILFHPANHALSQLNGCIAPVTELSGPGRGFASRKAFIKLKSWVYLALEHGERVKLIITSNL